MAQLVLDPRDTASSGGWTPREPIPPRLRSFGRFPNTHEWLRGDLVLFSALRPGLMGRMTRQAQELGGFAADDARWEHAAVYVGQDYICESVPFRTRYHPIYERVGTSLIRVRRPPGLSDEERYLVAISALAYLRQRYPVSEIAALAWHCMKGLWYRGTLQKHPPKLICSQLYADAFGRVTERVLQTNQGRATTPADLSLTSRLDDVPVCWRPLV